MPRECFVWLAGISLCQTDPKRFAVKVFVKDAFTKTYTGLDKAEHIFII